MLDSGSDSWFAEIDPLRDGIESYGGVDVDVAVDAVDVDAESSAGVAEEFVHHDLHRLAGRDDTRSRIQEFITPKDVVLEIVRSRIQSGLDRIGTLIVGQRSNRLRGGTIHRERRVHRDVVDDRILREAEERLLVQCRQRCADECARGRHRGDEGDEPRFRIDVALDHLEEDAGPGGEFLRGRCLVLVYRIIL